MSRRSRWIWRLLLVIVVVAGAGVLTVMQQPRLGLDLRGGTQIVLEARDSADQKVNDDTVSRTLEVLRRRVDQLGVAEPNIQRSGDRRIIVELPGLEDPRQALEVIGRTAQLEFHPVLAQLPPKPPDGQQPPEGQQDPKLKQGEEILPDEDGNRLHLGPARLTGDAVGDARAELDPQTGTQWTVAVDFRGRGGADWEKLTGEAACQPVGDPRRRVAIVLDQEVISSPQVDASIECDKGITGGSTVITGQFSQASANQLALLIRAGALPVPVEVVEQRTVGATLGDQAIEASLRAAVIGALATIVYMIVYYRIVGLFAALALLVYGLVSYAALLALGATLTLPGIAGFVLAIGMAVDANVLVFERMREEQATGARLRAVIDRGARGAISAILDSNITTLLAASILLFLSSGAVRGFGVTLSLGVVVSMFTALVVTRLFIELTVGRRWVKRHPAGYGVAGGGKVRAWLAEHGPDVIGRSRWWLGLSLVAVVLAVTGLAVRGLNFGVEFTGGRLIEYDTQRQVDPDQARAALADAGFPRAVVNETGSGNLSVRTGQVDNTGQDRLQEAVASVGGRTQIVRDEFIGPTIGEELRQRALLALGLALAAQLIYIAIRFRWTWGVSAVVAMFHDVTILLGVFAWLGRPIDGVFVAALLTVIGYSVNDSVVVFDRIRERLRSRVRDREPLDRMVNEACLQTVPRTINTGLGALFILVALYVLGGDTLRDFALALLIGILVGTYSSVLTAAPLATILERRWGAPAPPARGGRRPAARPQPRARTRTTMVDVPVEQAPADEEEVAAGVEPDTAAVSESEDLDGEPVEQPAERPRVRGGTTSTRPVRPAGARPRQRGRTDTKRRRRR